MKLQCSNSILQEEYRSSRDSFQPSKTKAQVPAIQRKLVLPWLKYCNSKKISSPLIEVLQNADKKYNWFDWC